MALRLPLLIEAEYRGTAPPSTFTNRETREVVEVAAKLKFEMETPDGEPIMLPVSGSQLDKCSPPLDYGGLVKGQRVELKGWAIIQERGSDRDSYVMFDAARVLEASKPVRAVG